MTSRGVGRSGDLGGSLATIMTEPCAHVPEPAGLPKVCVECGVLPAPSLCSDAADTIVASYECLKADVRAIIFTKLAFASRFVTRGTCGFRHLFRESTNVRRESSTGGT